MFTEEFNRDYLRLAFNILIMVYNTTYIDNVLRALWTSSKSTGSYALKAILIFLLPISVCICLLAYVLLNTQELKVEIYDRPVVFNVTLFSFYVSIVGSIVIKYSNQIDAEILKKDIGPKVILLQLLSTIYNFTWIMDGTYGQEQVSPYLITMCICAYIFYFHTSINSIIYIYNSPESIITRDERHVLMFLYDRARGSGIGSGMGLDLDLEKVNLLNGFLHIEGSRSRLGVGKDYSHGRDTKDHNQTITTTTIEDDDQNECVKLEEEESHFPREEILQELEEEDSHNDTTLSNPDKVKGINEKNPIIETEIDLDLDLETEVYYPIKKSFFTSSVWKSLFRKLDKYKFLEHTTYFEENGRAMIMRERYNYRNIFTDFIYRKKWNDLRGPNDNIHGRGDEPEQIEMMEL